jgi:uncharacterized membrane protein YozB (DUF420 family)
MEGDPAYGLYSSKVQQPNSWNRLREDAVLTRGILGSAAPWQADLTLLIEATMGIALLAGAVLARRRRYHAHAWCQSAVVLLNLVVIGFAMAPSFYIQLAPKIPQSLRKSYYAIAAGHAALGVVAELMGLYVIVAAGTQVLPDRLRLRNYRAWMRATLVLWWVVLLLGVATYVRWYVRL